LSLNRLSAADYNYRSRLTTVVAKLSSLTAARRTHIVTQYAWVGDVGGRWLCEWPTTIIPL